MKKLAIAGASLALAAMPVVGVFADGTGTVTTTTTDSLSVTVPSGCTIGTAANGGTDRADTAATFGSVTPTQTATDSTDPIVVTCNAGWTLTPTISTALSNGTVAIASGIAGGLDGDTSEWALQLAIDELAGTNNFSSYAVVNGTNKVTGTAAATALSITPTYKISIAPGQATGTYNGAVLYTVAAS